MIVGVLISENLSQIKTLSLFFSSIIILEKQKENPFLIQIMRKY